MATHHLLTLEEDGPVQMGFWVPNRVWATEKYLAPLRDSVDEKKRAGKLRPMRPELQELQDWVNAHSVYRMWVTSMIEQANAFDEKLDKQTKAAIRYQDGDKLWIRDLRTLFEIMNELITTSPAFNKSMMVGCPINGLLALAMGTDAGLALFHDATFNAQFKKVLDAWNAFLKSRESLDKLDIEDPEKRGSWISRAAWEAGVWDEIEFDRAAPGYGFDSWNSFFIRPYVPGARPFHGDPSANVCIGCETTPWQYEDRLELKTDFWIKDARYSLVDIFGGRRDLAEKFRGGQAYQGFLAATHYHRWHAPLSGIIVRSWVEPGTYFAERPGQGEDPGAWEGTECQPYLSHVAARAIFLFQHEQFGLVALVCIGMGEVSTCFIEPAYRVDEGAAPVKVERGTDVGRFEFGGSTHMMIFQRDRVVLEDWAVHAADHRMDPKPTPMGSIIARLRS